MITWPNGRDVLVLDDHDHALAVLKGLHFIWRPEQLVPCRHGILWSREARLWSREARLWSREARLWSREARDTGVIQCPGHSHAELPNIGIVVAHALHQLHSGA